MISLSLSLSLSQAKSEDQVHSDKSMVEQDRVWVIHKKGFSLGIIDKNTSPQKGNPLTTHISLLRSHVKSIDGWKEING